MLNKMKQNLKHKKLKILTLNYLESRVLKLLIKLFIRRFLYRLNTTY